MRSTMDSPSSGKETLRIRNRSIPRANETQSIVGDKKALERINSILEQFVGIADDELALSIWEVGQSQRNPHDFLIALRNGELSVFEFNQDLIFDLWGAVHDTIRSVPPSA
jgi:hypothetical protein